MGEFDHKVIGQYNKTIWSEWEVEGNVNRVRWKESVGLPTEVEILGGFCCSLINDCSLLNDCFHPFDCWEQRGCFTQDDCSMLDDCSLQLLYADDCSLHVDLFGAPPNNGSDERIVHNSEVGVIVWLCKVWMAQWNANSTFVLRSGNHRVQLWCKTNKPAI